MKKYIWLFVIGGIILTVILLTTILDANNYVHITALDYKAVVVDDKTGDRGKVVITEKLTFDVHALNASDGVWELWRTLPEQYVDPDKQVDYNILSVKRLSIDGQPAPLEFKPASKLYWRDSDYTSTKEGLGANRWYHSKGPYDGEYNYECVIFYVDNLYRETVVFELQYEMFNASMRYADCSEMDLVLGYGSDLNHLDSVSGQILIPEDKMPSSGNYSAKTFGTAAHDFPLTESKTANTGYRTFSFNLGKEELKFNPYNDYIQFMLISYGEDKHKFTQYASNHAYYYYDALDEILEARAEYDNIPQTMREAKIITLCVLSAVAAAVIALVLLYCAVIKKKNVFYKAQQHFDFYREIPSELDPMFAGALVSSKHKNSDKLSDGYAAAMLGLEQKGYIDIQKVLPDRDWSQDNTRIVAQNGSFAQTTENGQRELLTRSEELFLSMIRRHAKGNSITMKDFEKRIAADYQNTDDFNQKAKKLIQTTGKNTGYFQIENYKKVKLAAIPGVVTLFILAAVSLLINVFSAFTRLDLAFGGFFVLGAGFAAAAVVLLLVTRKQALLTQFGEDEYSKWRALYNFLNSETLMKERIVDDVAIWEEYLIYATAFGIAEKVLKALELSYPEYKTGDSRIFGNSYFRTRMFTRIYSRSIGRSMRRAVRTGRMNGFGGGFGGGGRGGLGGGGG